ncbi:MAG TPA: hypothetical protein VJI69_08285 [Bacteroidia bacterium]|nr:hypothetical protein [Bacteroidia bacterium]
MKTYQNFSAISGDFETLQRSRTVYVIATSEEKKVISIFSKFTYLIMIVIFFVSAFAL